MKVHEENAHEEEEAEMTTVTEVIDRKTTTRQICVTFTPVTL